MRSILLATTLLACAAAGAQTPAPAAPRITTPSGIVFESRQAGTGASPKASDTVTVNYRGTFPDGREFDSSYKRGQPTSFPLDHVIPCWTEAVQMMKVGGKAHITCPAKLAYGERGAGGVIPPNATLMFDIELLGIR
ncbi:MAG: FKBP-type peptidyl-prolyl cis-trans isomerase [Burkholderiales bacterium]